MGSAFVFLPTNPCVPISKNCLQTFRCEEAHRHRFLSRGKAHVHSDVNWKVHLRGNSKGKGLHLAVEAFLYLLTPSLPLLEESLQESR